MPPITLTKQQFLQRKPEGSYDRYLSYLKTNRPKRVAARKAAELDYLAPTPPKQIRSQITSQVNADVGPLLDELNRSFAARAKAGQEAITGYTGSFLDQIRGIAPAIGDVYGEAKQEQAGVSDALSMFLQGAGKDRAAELDQALTAAGQPTDMAQAPAVLGQGIAGTQAAMGASALSRLIAEGAAQQAYAAKAPDVAVASGLQSSRLFGSDLNAKLADALGGVTSRVPGTIADLISSRQNLEVQKALGKLGLEQDYAQLGQQQGQFEAGLGLDYEKLYANQAADVVSAQDKQAAARQKAVKSREDAVASVAEEAYRRAVKAVVTKRVAGTRERIDMQTGQLVPAKPARTTKTVRPFQAVYGELSAYVSQQLGRYGLKDDRVREIVMTVMKQAGLWPNPGRPPGGLGPTPAGR